MFIFFFGTRPGKKKEAPLPGVTCPYCTRNDTLHATLVPNYVHLFWIPVYRLRPTTFVRCSHCKKAYEGSTLTQGMQKGLDALMKA